MNNSQRNTKIAYWASTGLLSLALLGSGVSKLGHAPEVMANMERLGFPP